MQAARRPVHGRDQVTRFILGVVKRAPKGMVSRLVRINGEPGMLFEHEEGVGSALTLTVENEMISAVWIVVNPDKLTRAGEVSGPRH